MDSLRILRVGQVGVIIECLVCELHTTRDEVECADHPKTITLFGDVYCKCGFNLNKEEVYYEKGYSL